jgi:hypothetical protein
MKNGLGDPVDGVQVQAEPSQAVLADMPALSHVSPAPARPWLDPAEHPQAEAQPEQPEVQPEVAEQPEQPEAQPEQPEAQPEQPEAQPEQAEAQPEQPEQPEQALPGALLRRWLSQARLSLIPVQRVVAERSRAQVQWVAAGLSSAPVQCMAA